MKRFVTINLNYKVGTYTDSILFSTLKVPTNKEIKQISIINNLQVAWISSQVQNVDNTNRIAIIGYNNRYSTDLNDVPTTFFYLAE